MFASLLTRKVGGGLSGIFCLPAARLLPPTAAATTSSSSHAAFHSAVVVCHSNNNSKGDINTFGDEGDDLDENDPEVRLVTKKGLDLLNSPLHNKGTGFPKHEQWSLGIRGLVPPAIFSLKRQAERVMNRFNGLETSLQQYNYLMELQDRNETLFYRVLLDNVETLLPVVYTPTVGEACQQFSLQYRRTRGMYFSSADRGSFSTIAYHWSSNRVEVIVVTDGGRVLGLGDLGVNGMRIPIGKLSLYVTGAGIHPGKTLPIMFDAGTNNQALLDDPFYLGNRHERLEGEEYFSLLDEMMVALKNRWPRAMIQFEDFSGHIAAEVLDRYRDEFLCFNDDIQGTGAAVLAGVLSALKAQKLSSTDTLQHQRFVIAGAGSAGLGVADTLRRCVMSEGLTEEEASALFVIMDVDGAIGPSRSGLSSKAMSFANKEIPDGTSLVKTIKSFKPSVILGLTGVPGTFSQPAIETMTACLLEAAAGEPKLAKQPVIFALSNPVHLSECTAEQAYEWSNHSAIFASGSPFPEFKDIHGKTLHPSQANNMFIFPGIGLAATTFRFKKITDEMFFAAARRLADKMDPVALEQGRVYPSISEIREVSLEVAYAVAKVGFEQGLASRKAPRDDEDIKEKLHLSMYSPKYSPLVTIPKSASWLKESQ